MNKLLLAATMILTLAASARSEGSDWEKISGQNSSVSERRMVAVRDSKAWSELWSKHQKSGGKNLPPVDFSKETVIAVFLGQKPTGGFKVDLALQQDPLDSSRLFVLYKEIAPKSDSFVSQAVSRPFEIRKVRKAYASVVFEPNAEMRILPTAFTPERMKKVEGSMSGLTALAESLAK